MDVSLPEGTLLKQSVPFSLCSSRHPVEWVDSPSPGFQTGRDALGWNTGGNFGRQRWIVDGCVQRGLSWFIMVFYPPKMMEKKEELNINEK